MKTTHLILALALCGQLCAAQRFTAVLTVTNVPAAGQTIVPNLSTRTWVTNVTSPSVQIIVGADIPSATTNLWNQLLAYPMSGIVPAWVATNQISFAAGTDIPLGVTASGWGSITYSTQTVTTLVPVRVPLASEPLATRTNSATLLALGIGSYSQAPISQASPAAGELLGTTNTQTVSGAKTWTGANVFVGGVTTSNLVNRGAAISSPGATNYAEQFGSGATATHIGDTAIGYGATASGGYSFAGGYPAEATGGSSIALGGYAYGDWSIAIGGYVNAHYGIAIGNGEVGASNAVAIGYNSAAYGANSMAIGKDVTVSAADTIQVGSSAATVKIPGSFVVSGNSYAGALNATVGTATNGVYVSPRLTNGVVHATTLLGTIGTLGGGYLNGVGATNMAVTNLTASGTNVASGVMTTPQVLSTSLGAGNNAGIDFGAASYVRITSGPWAAFSICGIAGGSNGRRLTVVNATGYAMTLAHNSGVDPTPANRIYTDTGADITLTNRGVFQVIYDPIDSRWNLVTASPRQ